MEGLIRTVKADGKAEYQLLEQLRSRSEEVDRQVTERVSAILADVKARGDEAVLEYSRRFDKVVLDEMAFEDLTLNLSTCDLKCGVKSVHLNFKEFEILRLLMANCKFVRLLWQLMI